MKKKHVILTLCAALILLSGCSEQAETIAPNDTPTAESSSSSSTQSSSSSTQSSSSSTQSSSSSTQSSSSSTQSSSSSTQSSSSSTQSSSSSMQSSSTSMQSSSSSMQSSSGDIVKEPNEFYSGTVSENSPLTVSNGDVLGISEKVVCEKGGSINIEKGGILVIKSELELAGDIYVKGRLIIEENAVISGSGVIHVTDSFDDIDCKGTVKAKIDAPEPVEIDGVTYVGGILLVNKQYTVPKDYGDGLSKDLEAAVEEMRKASGFKMKISSGFRSYERQEYWYKFWCAKDGVEVASTYSAVPGHSEHQTGLAADITLTETSYANTAEGKWLAAHCYEYGLIIRYPADKVAITGYIYEPWHVRYLGKSTAKLVHDSGLCLEEFLGVSEVG